jgi:hypothetical protein
MAQAAAVEFAYDVIEAVQLVHAGRDLAQARVEYIADLRLAGADVGDRLVELRKLRRDERPLGLGGECFARFENALGV